MSETFGPDWLIYGFWIAVALIFFDPQGMSKIVKLGIVVVVAAVGLGVYNDKWELWDGLVAFFQ